MPIRKFNLNTHGITSLYMRYVNPGCDSSALTSSLKKKSSLVAETSQESLTEPLGQIFGIFRNQNNIVLKFDTDTAFVALYVPEVDKVIIGIRIGNYPEKADIVTNKKFFKYNNLTLKRLINQLIDEDRSFVTMFSADNPTARKWVYWTIAKGAEEIK